MIAKHKTVNTVVVKCYCKELCNYLTDTNWNNNTFLARWKCNLNNHSNFVLFYKLEYDSHIGFIVVSIYYNRMKRINNNNNNNNAKW